MTHTVKLVEYILPNGRREVVDAPVKDEATAQKGLAIWNAGFEIAGERLSTGAISFTIADNIEEIDLAIVVIRNTNMFLLIEQFSQMINGFDLAKYPRAGMMHDMNLSNQYD